MPKWVAPTLAIIGALLIVYLFGGWIWSAVISVVQTAIHAVVAVAMAIITFTVAAFLSALPFLVTIAAAAIVVIAIVAAVAVVVIVAIALAGQISKQLLILSEQITRLHADFKFQPGEAARDGAFLALVATLCGLIAYMGTDDFLNQISAIRFFAAGAIGLVAAKLFLFFPSRIAKGCGMFLTFLIMAGSIVFVLEQYGFAYGTMNGFTNVRNAVLNPHNGQKVLLLGIIAMLWFLTLWFPFTLAAWRRLLSRPELPSAQGG